MKVLNIVSGVAFAALLASPAGAQKADWTHYDTLQIEGVEKLPGGETTLRAVKANDRFAFQTTRGIEGVLNGLPRHEIRTPQSVVTWLDTAPEWALLLPESSLSDSAKMFQPLRASRQDLRGNWHELERKFGQGLRDMGRETVCGRPCQVLSVTDNSPGIKKSQKLWIDLETGLILRRDETGGDYAYQMKRFTPGVSVEPSTFQLPAGTQTIRGLVTPEILQHIGEKHTPADYTADTQKAQKTAKTAGGGWIRSVGLPPGFDYVQTVVQEKGTPAAPSNLLASANPITLDRVQALLSTLKADMSENNFPTNYTLTTGENGEFFQHEIHLNSDNSTLLDGATMQVQVMIMRSGDGTTQNETEINDTVARTLDSLDLNGASPQIFVLNGDSLTSENYNLPWLNEAAPATLSWPLLPSTTNHATATVESDFVDRATGDTVAFYQLRNRKWDTLLHGMQMQTGSPLQSTKLGAVQTVTATTPFALNLIVWHENGAEYVLTSTRLDAKQLLALAENSAPITPN